MIVGLGVDLFDVSRMRAELSRQGGDLSHLFGPRELQQCSGRADPATDLATLFAAKEAIIKALGDDHGVGLPWREIEVLPDAEGKLRATFTGRLAALVNTRRIARVDLSTARACGVALASAVLEAVP